MFCLFDDWVGVVRARLDIIFIIFINVIIVFLTQVTVESLSSGSATESQSIYGNFYHNNTSSEQQGLFDGLQSNTKYQIVITANNGAGSSPPSSPVLFKTLKPGENIE